MGEPSITSLRGQASLPETDNSNPFSFPEQDYFFFFFNIWLFSVLSSCWLLIWSTFFLEMEHPELDTTLLQASPQPEWWNNYFAHILLDMFSSKYPRMFTCFHTMWLSCVSFINYCTLAFYFFTWSCWLDGNNWLTSCSSLFLCLLKWKGGLKFSFNKASFFQNTNGSFSVLPSPPQPFLHVSIHIWSLPTAMLLQSTDQNWV